MSDTMWGEIGPGSITGYGGAAAGGGSGGVTSGVQSAVVTAAGVNAPRYSPDNPLFWFGALLLAAGGFIFVSTHVKAGPLKGSASI